MNLRNIISEAAKEKDKEKLLNFLQRAKNGNISNQGMLAAGFNLRNTSKNSESKLAETLSIYLDINVTENDLKNVLRELGAKRAQQIADSWAQQSS